MAKRVGVVLSGCGVQDGSEIHEAVLLLLALDKAGLEAVIMAPDIPQKQVMNHRFGEPMEDQRNVLVESARIARGNIKIMKYITELEIDALAFPGGFGAVKNLSDFLEKGSDCEVHPQVQRLILECNDHNKPIAACCIAPVILAQVLGRKGIEVTVGDDTNIAEKINAMGAVHKNCPACDVVVDERNRIVTAPAYMLCQSISDVAVGIEKMVSKLAEMIG